MPIRIIAVVGMAGSGKSVLSKYLSTQGYPVIRFGQMIVDEVTARGLKITPENEQLVREELREKYGMDACAQLALPAIKATLEKYPLVVIDGLYSLSEYKKLSESFCGEVLVLAVFTPKEMRYNRLASRAERPLSREQAEERDWMEIERIEKGGPIALADFTIVNDVTEEQFLETVQAFVTFSLEKQS